MIELTIKCSSDQAAALEAERKAHNAHIATLKPPGNQLTFGEYAQVVWNRMADDKLAQHKQREREEILSAFAVADEPTREQVRSILSSPTKPPIREIQA
jgi:hypothetical protein